jgi:hypothetical protein
MIQFHRNLRAFWLVPLLCAVACKAQSPSDTPTPPVGPTPPQNADAGLNNPSAASSQDPSNRPEPECGPMMPPAPADCDRSAWFCNAAGDCSCRKPPGSAATSDVLVRSLPEAPEPTAGDVQTKPRDPACAGASVSAPQGDCLVINWYCNGSGLCRCRA